MFTYSISTGSIENGYTITWSAGRLRRRAQQVRQAVPQLDPVRRPADDPHPADRLPGRLHHRLPRRALQEPAPVPGHRPVLHQLPDPDDQLEDPARRRGPDPRPRSSTPSASCPAPSASSDTPIAQVAGITYNFLPFMILPLYVALEKIDIRLIEAAEDLYANRAGGLPPGDAPAGAAGRVRRLAADVHPGDGRLRQRRAAGQPRHPDDRQRHPEPAPRPERLPGRVGPVVHPDGRRSSSPWRSTPGCSAPSS